MRCDSREGRAILALSLCTIVVLVLGFPHAIMASIRYESAARLGVHNPHVQTKLGWAFAMFRSPHHAWLIRRVWLTVWICGVATLVDNPSLQICVTLVILLHAYSAHCAERPYKAARLNQLETYGLAWTATTVTSPSVH